VARVTVKSGPEAGRSIELDGEIVIGREGADLTIADPELSRRHALLRPVDGGVEIEDLGSTNGTFVNGERIGEPVKIVTGASVELGDSRLAVEPDVPPAAAPDAPPAVEPGAEPAAAARSRRPLVALVVALVVVAAAVAAVLALSGGSEETETHTLNARVTTLALSEPSSLQVSGALSGEPFGRSAVVIQRRMPVAPKQGGRPVSVRGFVLVTASSGVMSLNFNGTIRVTEAGGEQLSARGTAGNGNQEFEGVKGSIRITGGRITSVLPLGRYRITGELEY
jgi:hypothetical protein